MNLGDLMAEMRRLADDTVVPHHTDDATLARWATEAEREACVRASLLFDDDVRAGVTTITVVAGTAKYALSPLVHDIDAASFTATGSTRPRDLTLRGMDWLREQCDWQTETSNRPCVLADDGRGSLRLWPTPSAAGTLQLAVYRYPITALEVDVDVPEIHEQHHEGLVQWMLYRYWSQKDSELYDPQRAQTALEDFTGRFGERKSADVMRKHRERRRVTTRYGGY